MKIFLKHKKFKDVCIEVITTETSLADGLIEVVGSWWNMGVETCYPINQAVEFTSSIKELETDWEVFYGNPPMGSLRIVKWETINILNNGVV